MRVAERHRLRGVQERGQAVDALAEGFDIGGEGEANVTLRSEGVAGDEGDVSGFEEGGTEVSRVLDDFTALQCLPKVVADIEEDV